MTCTTTAADRDLRQQDNVLNIHALMDRSEVNGPGLRAVIWLQGCHRRCPGCFNPDAQPFKPRLLMPVDQVVHWLEAIQNIEGVTISGGEPFLQAEALAALLQRLRHSTDLSVLVYTGFLYEELAHVEHAQEVLRFTDVLIDGPYDQTQPASDGLRGSTNQRIHLLTNRYSPHDFPAGLRFEIVLLPDGSVIRTGVASSHLPRGQA